MHKILRRRRAVRCTASRLTEERVPLVCGMVREIAAELTVAVRRWPSQAVANQIDRSCGNSDDLPERERRKQLDRIPSGIAMSLSDAEIFNQWINKLGEFGGIVPADLASRLMVGGRFVTRFLPTVTCTETIVRKIAPEEALELGTAVLSKLGELVPDDDIRPPRRVLRAVIGAGFLDMNPAIVRLEILDRDPGECEFRISAAAKEGLIKQHAAPKAVKRVTSELLTQIGLYK